ncbi:MAG: PIN domain-containing protein [Actinomycetota bacterium]
MFDTSAVVALQDRRDRMYDAALAAVQQEPGPYVLPAGILAEVGDILTTRSPGAMDQLLGSLIDGSLFLDCGDQDPPRVRELMARFRDLRLGYADAAVIACAERNGGRVLTFDRRDFEVIARDVPITVVPEDAP